MKVVYNLSELAGRIGLNPQVQLMHECCQAESCTLSLLFKDQQFGHKQISLSSAELTHCIVDRQIWAAKSDKILSTLTEIFLFCYHYHC